MYCFFFSKCSHQGNRAFKRNFDHCHRSAAVHRCICCSNDLLQVDGENAIDAFNLLQSSDLTDASDGKYIAAAFQCNGRNWPVTVIYGCCMLIICIMVDYGGASALIKRPLCAVFVKDTRPPADTTSICEA